MIDNLIIQKYRPLVLSLSRKYWIPSLGDAEDMEQFLYEKLIQIDIKYLMSHPGIVKRHLKDRIIDELRKEKSFSKKPEVSFDDMSGWESVEANNDMSFFSRYEHYSKYDFTQIIELILMKEPFKERLSLLINHLEDEEIELLKFYIKNINEGISPSDRYICRELYGFSSNSSSFRNLKKSLKTKMYHFFYDFLPGGVNVKHN